VKSTKVNILFLSNSLVGGGAEKQVISLLNGLDIKKFNLSLGYLKNVTTLLSQIKKDRLEGIKYFNVEKKLDLGAVDNIKKYIDEHSIDIIISTNTYPLLYSFLSSRRSLSKPVMVAVFHTTILLDMKIKLLMFIYRPLFLLQRKLVYVCKNQKKYWRRRGLRAQSDTVIYNGVDTQYFKDIWTDQQKTTLRKKLNFGPSDYVIGICAVLRPEKAHGDLLIAVQRLQQKGINAKCLIIGDGNERQNIERKIIDLELENSVNITGFVEDVRPFIAICNVMAIVSHAVETFSIAALESMSLGKPLVMSNIGGAKEQVQSGKNGYLFQAGDIEGLAMGLTEISSTKTQLEFGNNSRKIVEDNYTLEKMINNFNDMLLKIKLFQG